MLIISSIANSSSAGALNFSGALQNNMDITAGERSLFINLWIHNRVEFTQYVRRTCSTIAFLVSNLFYPLSHFSLFFLIYPFNTFIYFLFRYETRRLGFSYLLYLCIFLPASIPLPDR